MFFVWKIAGLISEWEIFYKHLDLSDLTIIFILKKSINQKYYLKS